MKELNSIKPCSKQSMGMPSSANNAFADNPALKNAENRHHKENSGASAEIRQYRQHNSNKREAVKLADKKREGSHRSDEVVADEGIRFYSPWFRRSSQLSLNGR